MALVCKQCGYKQYDDETIKVMKKRFPDLEEHDIPYYCGACLDNASTEEYIDMEQEMYNLECPLGGDETNDCADCAYAGDYHFINGECVRREEEKQMYNHYVVVLDWATEEDESVQILGIAHTLSDAEKIFNERVVEEKRFAEDNGYSIEDDTNHVFSAGIMGYWRDNHTTLYIQGVNSYENSNSIA